jgi:hypothetical protein
MKHTQCLQRQTHRIKPPVITKLAATCNGFFALARGKFTGTTCLEESTHFINRTGIKAASLATHTVQLALVSRMSGVRTASEYITTQHLVIQRTASSDAALGRKKVRLASSSHSCPPPTFSNQRRRHLPLRVGKHAPRRRCSTFPFRVRRKEATTELVVTEFRSTARKVADEKTQVSCTSSSVRASFTAEYAPQEKAVPS